MFTLLVVCYLAVLTFLALFNIYKIKHLILYFIYKRKPIIPQSHFSDLPYVTVQLPVYNEKYVIERLVLNACNLEYPREKLEIQILDDSTDATSDIAKKCTHRLSQQGYIVRYIHRGDRSGFKAGALQNGLQSAQGEFIAVFDADFIPPKNFLKDTIQHFTNPNVGLVQARWGFINRNNSMLTRIQSIFLNGHFIIEHMARNRSGRFFNFNGTAGIWRKQTIDSCGGWQSDTITEDLDISYRAQLKGWEFVYEPDVVVDSELPATIHMLKNQQFRWTKGMSQCAKKLLPKIWKSRINVLTKIDASMHLLSNSGYLNTTILALLIVPTLIYFKEFFHSWSFFYVVFYFAANFISIFFYYAIVEREAHGFRWSNFPNVFMMIIIGIGLSINSSIAILEAVFGKKSEFVRTPKYSVGSSQKIKKAELKKLDYAVPFNKAVIVEVVFLLYFVFNGIWAAVTRNFHIIPVSILFFFSYMYVLYSYYASASNVKVKH